jgi:5-methylcytosine-specific restriction protein A
MARRIKRRSELKTHVGRSDLDARRGTSRDLGYDHHWQRVAKLRREADNHLCQLCLAENRLTPSSDVDHIVPLHVRLDWRLEFDNTQVICRPHHRKKTSADARRYGSSTAQTLTADQERERMIARQLVHAPRAGPGGPVKYGHVSPESVRPPARIPPRNWTPGGSP